MISSKKLAQLSKKWQGVGGIGRRRVATDGKDCSILAGKGNCIVYSSDGKRFEIPLACLRTTVFEELLKISCEQFGFTSGKRITLPCDAAVMEYVMCLLRREASEDVEKALLSSILMPCHQTSRIMQVSSGYNQQLPVCSSWRLTISRALSLFAVFPPSIFFSQLYLGAQCLCNIFPMVCGCADGCM